VHKYHILCRRKGEKERKKKGMYGSTLRLSAAGLVKTEKKRKKKHDAFLLARRKGGTWVLGVECLDLPLSRYKMELEGGKSRSIEYPENPAANRHPLVCAKLQGEEREGCKR